MVEHTHHGPGLVTWGLRLVLALAALAAPIITYRAFTDADTPDPARQQRLREAGQGPGPGPDRTRGATTDPYLEGRP